MAEVKVKSVTLSGTDKKGNAVFVAEGTVGDRAFDARTIQWKGEPIFKVQEGGSHLGLKTSSFSRGERIQVARVCKAARIEKFGEGHKEKVAPELETGETVTLTASSADESSADESSAGLTSRAAGRRQAALKASINGEKSQKHPSGLPMHASISALKRSV